MDVELVMYASGWNYDNEDQELIARKNGKWVPNTKDFVQLAKTSGNVRRGVNSIQDFVRALDMLVTNGELARSDNVLKHLAILAHGNGLQISFSGELDPNRGIKTMAPPNEQISENNLKRT